MNELKYSRPLGVAARLGENAADRHQFVNKRVLLHGDSEFLYQDNGRHCLMYSLRLLPRICAAVSVYVPREVPHLREECRHVISAIQFETTIELLDDCPDFAKFDAILFVGFTTNATLPWTTINSNGWVARVSSGEQSLSKDCDNVNPVAAMAAASLGVGEVFKRLVRIDSRRGRLLNGLTFSLLDYSCGNDVSGPSIPLHISCSNLLLVGVGAIGNGIIQLLRDLPLTGEIGIVDRQGYGEENWGTCMCIGPNDFKKKKVEFAKTYMSNLTCTEYAENVQDFSSRLQQGLRHPRIILNALDNVEARHMVQNIWPDYVIDGAIGDFGCQVSRHPWGPDIACLMCQYEDNQRESAESMQMNATGLRLDVLQNPDGLLEDAHIESAPPDKQDFLRALKGMKICSVVQESVAKYISENADIDFAPSVPFVAAMSAAFVCAELIKTLCGTDSNLEPLYQFDFLIGPEKGIVVPAARKRDCICHTRARNISKFRKSR